MKHSIDLMQKHFDIAAVRRSRVLFTMADSNVEMFRLMFDWTCKNKFCPVSIGGNHALEKFWSVCFKNASPLFFQ